MVFEEVFVTTACTISSVHGLNIARSKYTIDRLAFSPVTFLVPAYLSTSINSRRSQQVADENHSARSDLICSCFARLAGSPDRMKSSGVVWYSRKRVERYVCRYLWRREKGGKREMATLEGPRGEIGRKG